MSWQAAIPITLSLVGLFHYLLAQVLFDSKAADEMKVIGYSWLGFAYLFFIAAVFSVHLYAANPVNSTDLSSATRVGYLLALGSFGWSCIYFVVKGVKHFVDNKKASGAWWRR